MSQQGQEHEKKDDARSDQPQPGSCAADPRDDDQCGSLLKVGDTVKYDFLGAIWTDEVVAIEGDFFWTQNHGAALHLSALVNRQ